MNPGRSKIEEREALWITTGDHVLDANGVEYVVTYWRTSSSHPGAPRKQRLVVEPIHGKGATLWRLDLDELVRVRVPEADR